MARYNSVTPSAAITTAGTVSTPNQGLLTTFGGTGPYTVTIPDPKLFAGEMQTFFNASGGAITLSVAAYTSPSQANIVNNALTATTFLLSNNTAVSLMSNGTNYYIVSGTSFGLTNTTVSSSTTTSSNTLNWCDTTSAGFTLTLPASPIQGDIVRIVDISSTFNTNNLTVGRNGNLIQGDAANMTVATQGAAFDLIYYNVAKGWRIFTI
jgi:hypothetical protein